MREPIFVINAGSSSIKFAVYATGEGRVVEAVFEGEISSIGHLPQLKVRSAIGETLAKRSATVADHDRAVAEIFDWIAGHLGSEMTFDGVGHRVVHGGERYSSPVLIDDEVLERLGELIPLAPLHQPHNVAAIQAVRTTAPRLRQVACFDTAFHQSQPAIARALALPPEFAAKGLRRYGFHGLSYEYVASKLWQKGEAEGKTVIAHLGNGASLCAIEDGSSVATTMGFSTLDGLIMGTRPGTLDPGVILYLLQHEGMTAEEIATLLYKRSGLLGVSGISSDMRTLLESDAPAARQAIDLFIYRIGREIGSLAAALGGLDRIVFTGGIGENAPEIRKRVSLMAAWLGVDLDEEANLRGDARISTAESATSLWIVPTDENLMIAQHTRRALDGSS